MPGGKTGRGWEGRAGEGGVNYRLVTWYENDQSYTSFCFVIFEVRIKRQTVVEWYRNWWQGSRGTGFDSTVQPHQVQPLQGAQVLS